MDRMNDPNDPVDRRVDNTYVDSSSDSGVTWFIVGALVIAAGVLAYLYFGGDADTTADTSPTAIEAPEAGRAATPAAPGGDTDSSMAPAAPADPAPASPAPASPAPATPGTAAP